MTLLAPTLQKYFTTYAVGQRGLSPNTIAAYRDAWRLLVKHLADAHKVPACRLSLDVITPEAISGFLDRLETARGNLPATRNARMSALKAVIATAIPDNPGHSDHLGRIMAMPAKRVPKHAIAYLAPEETEALLAAPDDSTWTGRRDRALLALAAQTGLRMSEITRLTLDDVRLSLPASVSCVGKGRKHRTTPLTSTTTAILGVYLEERRHRAGRALFPGPSGQALSRDAVERRLAKHLATASAKQPTLAAKHITMHSLRHTAAMRLLEAGTDPAVIALWLGHESVATTSVYLHADMSAKQAAIDNTRPPGVEPGRYQPEPDILAWLNAL